MKINIELSEENVANVLAMSNFVTEKVLVWYNKLDDDCYHLEELGSYQMVVAYPKYHRPEVLEKEKIMVDDVKHMEVTEVVNELFNELLINKLFS